MATKKTSLSTGTLNLKFMMRSATSSDAIPALDKAKVVDEAEWHIAPEVREAWGLSTNGNGSGSSSAQSTSRVLYEDSYLPFMTDDSPRGHRKFKDGVLTAVEEPSVPSEDPDADPTPDTSSPSQPKTTSASYTTNPPSKFPKSISRQQSVRQPSKQHVPSQTSPQKSKAVKPPPTSKASVPAASSGFLKPAGIDAVATSLSSKKDKKRKATSSMESLPQSVSPAVPSPSTPTSTTNPTNAGTETSVDGSSRKARQRKRQKLPITG